MRRGRWALILEIIGAVVLGIAVIVAAAFLAILVAALPHL